MTTETLSPETAESRAAQLRANLEALRTHQPEWADRIERTPDPPDATPCRARDGTWSWRLTRGGRPAWMGRTSMPRVSAEALFGNIQREGSVVLPGILSGAETLEVARRVADNAAVFIVEPDVGLLRLALQIHDYTALIEQRRLVLLTTDEGERQHEPHGGLTRFFLDREGYEYPRRLLRTPQVDPEDFSRIQAVVETGAAQVREARERLAIERVRAWTEHVSRVTLDDPASTPGVMIVTASCQPTARTWAYDLASAAAAAVQTDRPASRIITHVPDRPDRADWGSALASAAINRTSLIVIIDPGATEWSRIAPPNVCILRWLTPQADARAALLRTSDREILLASTVRQYRFLKDAGAPVRLLEPPLTIGDENLKPLLNDDHVTVVAGEAPSDDPAALGVGLPSHETLIETARSLSLERARGAGCLDAADILASAERHSGIVVEDPNVRAWLMEIVRSRIVPVARRRAVIEALRSAGLIRATGGAMLRGRTGPATDWRISRPRVLVLAHVSPADAVEIIAALCAGIHVVAWRYTADPVEEHPLLHHGLHGVGWFDRPTEAVRLVQRFLAGSDPPVRPPVAWLASQGMDARWMSLLDMARRMRRS